MSGWQVGDLALFVGPQDRGDPEHGMRKGAIYCVAKVGLGGRGLQFLECPVWGGWEYWRAECFRKITPGADIEGFEERRRIPEKVEA